MFLIRWCDRYIKFLKSHMSVALIGTGVVMFFFAVLFFQGFLQNEYQQYLFHETSRTEGVVLDVSAANINGMLKNAVVVGAEIAMDEELYSITQRVIRREGSVYQGLLDLNGKLNGITHYGSNIAATALVTEDGMLCEYGRYWSGSNYSDLWKGEEQKILDELYEEVMKSASGCETPSYRISTVPLVHSDFPEMILFHIAYPLVGNRVRKAESETVLVLTMRLDAIVKSSALANSEQSDYITEYITDADGKVIYHENREWLGKPEGELETQQVKKLENGLDYFDWMIHIGIDTSRMNAKVKEMFRRGMLIYLGLLLVVMLVWQLVLWQILKPVGVIGKAMENIRSGAPGDKIEIRGTHELWRLAQQYNYTVEALEQQQKETKREYEAKTRAIERCNAAEKEALESQINTHFLCNTLGAINYSAMENGDTEVSILLKHLSNILYYAFSQETKEVTMGDEIAWVKQYLYLQKFRLMDVFDYEIEFQEEYSEWPCCKFFLQPFVENSILHGFEGWDNGGKIIIAGKEFEGRFRVQIWDNGRGMEPEVAEAIRAILQEENGLERGESGIGIGIRNVMARLRMYYGTQMEASMNTWESGGTCFTLWLPLPGAELEEELVEDEEY